MLQAQEAAFGRFFIGPYGMPGTGILSTKILRPWKFYLPFNNDF